MLTNIRFFKTGILHTINSLEGHMNVQESCRVFPKPAC